MAGAGLLFVLLSKWRQPRAGKDEVLEALETLKLECASVYAQVAESLARAGPLPPQATAALAARAAKAASGGAHGGAEEAEEDEAAEGQEKEDAATKVLQAIDQPLVLTEALQEAAAKTAAQLVPDGHASAEALEQVLVHFQDEPEVHAATTELRAMHEACLNGRQDAWSEAPSCEAAMSLWEADAALDMLRELGRAKAEALRAALKRAAIDGSAARGLGCQVLQACEAAEDLVWEQKWPGDGTRRSAFAPALARLEAKDRRFRERRAAAEREAEALAAAPAAAATHRVLAAF